jgi:GAF domain-containing protein
VNPVLQATVSAAVTATSASQGWILAVHAGRLRVVAAVGEGTGDLLGVEVELGSGTAGFVASSGQPVALAPSGTDARLAEGVTALISSQPSSILSVPCGADDVVGVLELVDKAGGGPFSFDDVELATLLASIAGVALEEDGGVAPVRLPTEIGADLARLASDDPAAYLRLAPVIEALLDR